MKKKEHIEKISLSKQALDIIKEKILSGKSLPGSRFIIDDLASELGISRTPIRDALNKLVSLGLIVYDGKSYSAAGYKEKDVRELFSIRRALEVVAIREAIDHLSDHEISKYRDLCKKSANQIKNAGRDRQILIKLDNKLHQLIYEGSSNDRLKKILCEVKEKILLIHEWGYITKNVEYVESASMEEYFEFLKSLETRDKNKATQLIERHLIMGEQFTLECLGLLKKDDLHSQQDIDFLK